MEKYRFPPQRFNIFLTQMNKVKTLNKLCKSNDSGGEDRVSIMIADSDFIINCSSQFLSYVEPVLVSDWLAAFPLILS